MRRPNRAIATADVSSDPTPPRSGGEQASQPENSIPPEPQTASPILAAPAATLRLRDVRAAFRLINEVRELGADPQKWRPHMVRALRKLVKASIVVSSEVHFRRGRRAESTAQPAGASNGVMMHVTDIGWVSDHEGKVSQIHTERDDESPDTFWLTAGDGASASTPTGVDAASAPGDLIPVKPTRSVYGGTTFILSQAALPHAGAVDQLGLHREWGDHPFTPAEHRLVRLFHSELARLWKRDVLRQAQDPASDLPPRLAQTLDELVDGASEKQIAKKLELSRHTIHNYVKALHQRFDVNSRGELLAKVGAARVESAPRLSLTLPKRRRSIANNGPGQSGRGSAVK